MTVRDSSREVEYAWRAHGAAVERGLTEPGLPGPHALGAAGHAATRRAWSGAVEADTRSLTAGRRPPRARSTGDGDADTRVQLVRLPSSLGAVRHL